MVVVVFGVGVVSAGLTTETEFHKNIALEFIIIIAWLSLLFLCVCMCEGPSLNQRADSIG